MDKLTVKYISLISKEASNICLGSGKKTITVTHVVEGLRKIGLEKHIKQLYSELDPKSLLDEEDIKENIPNDMKAKINGRKKKVKDKKHKKIEMTEDMINEQSMLFQQSRIEAYELMMKENIENLTSNFNSEGNEVLYTNNVNGYYQAATSSYCNKDISNKSVLNNKFIGSKLENELLLNNNEEENYDD